MLFYINLKEDLQISIHKVAPSDSDLCIPCVKLYVSTCRLNPDAIESERPLLRTYWLWITSDTR